MHGGLKKRCALYAVATATVVILVVLNCTIVVLTAKSYKLTKQLGTVQAPLYSTGAPQPGE